jgi:hypothetical protein
VVYVRDRDVGDVVHCGIVEKGAVVPVTAFIPIASVAEAIVYTAVEADFWSPISVVECIGAVAVCPIGWRP